MSRQPADPFWGDEASTEKVEAMLRRGKSDKFVAAYLGMPISRVEGIGRRMLRSEGEDRWADHGEPLSGIEELWARQIDAEQGSRALLEAMRRAAA